RRYQSALDISNELADLKSGLSSESPAGAGQPTSPAATSGAREVPGAAAGKAPVPVRYLVFAGFMAAAGLIFSAVYLRRDAKIPVPPLTRRSRTTAPPLLSQPRVLPSPSCPSST